MWCTLFNVVASKGVSYTIKTSSIGVGVCILVSSVPRYQQLAPESWETQADGPLGSRTTRMWCVGTHNTQNTQNPTPSLGRNHRGFPRIASLICPSLQHDSLLRCLPPPILTCFATNILIGVFLSLFVCVCQSSTYAHWTRGYTEWASIAIKWVATIYARLISPFPPFAIAESHWFTHVIFCTTKHL